MSYVFDLYVPGHSWLHRLDPRVKLWAVIVGFVFAFLQSSIVAQIALLLGLHILLIKTAIPWRVLRNVWQQMAMLVILILILQPFFQPSGQIVWTFGPLSLTLGGLQRAALLATRALVLAFITATLLFTTDQHALVRAFMRLGLPYTWGLTLSLTLRFLPAIQSLFTAVREAQAARGWEPQGHFIQRMREYLPVLVAVVIGTLRLSDQLTLALAARGLNGSKPRTIWQNLHMRPSDWLAFWVVTLLFIGLIVVNLTQLPL